MSRESSLKEFDRLADRIRQHRQGDKSPILVVEGDGDRLTLADLLEGVDIFIAGNRPTALRESKQLAAWSFDRFACVVDRDFDLDLEDTGPLDERLHPYEEPDLEAMLIANGALASLLEHLGSTQKLTGRGGATAVVLQLCASMRAIASLRRENAVNGWGLAFDRVDLASKIDRRTLSLNVARYCQALSATTQHSVSTQQLIEVATRADRSLGVRGKDVVAAAGVALRQAVGSLPSAACTEDALSCTLRFGGARFLRECNWTSDLRAVIAA